jgi:phosphoglycerol transferase MdoB-like AlkP superfamily enzyme
MVYYPYSFYSFQDVITQWQQIGVFDIILPLILIFTIVYAILDRTKIFGKNKNAINAVIALAISIFTIQNVAVTGFFKILFSQVAFGLAILIAVILLTALLLGEKETHVWRLVIMVIGFIIFIWILSRAANEYQSYYGAYGFGLFTSDWWAMYAPSIILVGLVAVVVIAVVASSKPSGTGAKLKDIAKDLVGEFE